MGFLSGFEFDQFSRIFARDLFIYLFIFADSAKYANISLTLLLFLDMETKILVNCKNYHLYPKIFNFNFF